MGMDVGGEVLNSYFVEAGRGWFCRNVSHSSDRCSEDSKGRKNNILAKLLPVVTISSASTGASVAKLLEIAHLGARTFS